MAKVGIRRRPSFGSYDTLGSSILIPDKKAEEPAKARVRMFNKSTESKYDKIRKTLYDDADIVAEKNDFMGMLSLHFNNINVFEQALSVVSNFPNGIGYAFLKIKKTEGNTEKLKKISSILSAKNSESVLEIQDDNLGNFPEEKNIGRKSLVWQRTERESLFDLISSNDEEVIWQIFDEIRSDEYWVLLITLEVTLRYPKKNWQEEIKPALESIRLDPIATAQS